MEEPRTRPPGTTVDGDPVRRRIRQKTAPSAEANAVFKALGGDEGFCYIEALQTYLPHLVGFAKTSHCYDLDDHAWISAHWKSSSQKRKADMGDTMADDAEMTEAIASTAGRMLRSGNADHKRTGKTDHAFAAQSVNLSVEVIIDLADIDIDALEKQPEMAFGNLG